MKNAITRRRPLVTIRNDKEPGILAILGACACGALFAVVLFHGF